MAKKEYIEREKVLHEMTSNPLPNDTQHLYLAMRNMVKKAPTADVVEVVRCKDCKHANDNNMVEGFCYCEKIYRGMPNDGFCSYGEGRK